MVDIAHLKQEGIITLPYTFSQLDQFKDYLSKCPVYDNHVRKGVEANPAGVGAHPWMCHDLHDVILAPGWFEVGLLLTPYVSEFFGQQARIYSLNAFYTEPGALPKEDIQQWHRDGDDVKFVALFVYCTDVLTDDDGPHQYCMGTYNETEVGRATTIYGKAGTMFLECPRGYHRGLVPQSGRRMIAWIRWGVSEQPASYGWDKNTPVDKNLMGDRYPTDPIMQKAIELVVK